MEEEINFISVIDYIGEINGGVAVLLSMKVVEKIYQIAYWFDKTDNYMMSVDDNFLQDYNIKNIYEYKNYKKLAYYIHTFVLDNKDEIFKGFKKWRRAWGYFEGEIKGRALNENVIASLIEFLAGFENSLGILGTFALVKASLPYPDS